MKKQDFKLAIGLMSGTSMDGIDAALIESDGLGSLRVLSTLSYSYSEDFRRNLKSSLEIAQAIVDRGDRPSGLDIIEKQLTLEHATIVKRLLQKSSLKPKDIDIIGFHGQTILHRPHLGLTVQLGDGSLLAKETQINVIYDMRSNDMAHQGQGAPLVPIYHAALATKQQIQLQFPVAFINIGGISNLTLVKSPNFTSDNNLAAFDCGPGNVLIDQWMMLRDNKAFDRDGTCGLAGHVNKQVLDRLMSNAVFQQKSPQSLDWKNFQPLDDKSLALEDGAATLAFLTAKQIFKSFKFLDEKPNQLVISGGGTKNKAIMKYIKILANPAGLKVVTADDIGLDSTFIEAEAWAYLAIRSLKKLPLTYPQTTGCTMPVTGGVLALYNG